jgi:hypothetical protein
MVRSHRGLAAVILTAVLVGCTDRLGPAGVAGTYFLETVNGLPLPLPGINAPVAGTITLTATGMVERRISYTIDAQGKVREFTATGTFQLKGSELRLALQDGTYLWTPSAELVGTTITLTYPNPADGPDIVERYLHR